MPRAQQGGHNWPMPPFSSKSALCCRRRQAQCPLLPLGFGSLKPQTARGACVWSGMVVSATGPFRRALASAPRQMMHLGQVVAIYKHDAVAVVCDDTAIVGRADSPCCKGYVNLADNLVRVNISAAASVGWDRRVKAQSKHTVKTSCSNIRGQACLLYYCTGIMYLHVGFTT